MQTRGNDYVTTYRILSAEHTKDGMARLIERFETITENRVSPNVTTKLISPTIGDEFDLTYRVEGGKLKLEQSRQINSGQLLVQDGKFADPRVKNISPMPYEKCAESP